MRRVLAWVLIALVGVPLGVFAVALLVHDPIVLAILVCVGALAWAIAEVLS